MGVFDSEDSSHRCGAIEPHRMNGVLLLFGGINNSQRHNKQWREPPIPGIRPEGRHCPADGDRTIHKASSQRLAATAQLGFPDGENTRQQRHDCTHNRDHEHYLSTHSEPFSLTSAFIDGSFQRCARSFRLKFPLLPLEKLAIQTVARLRARY